MRLSGFKIEGKYDLAMCLMETAPTMIAERVLTYMDLQTYIPRSLEITGTRKDKVSRPDSSGTVREVIKTSYEVADTSTDLLLRVALQRRGLALEMGGSWPTSHTSPSRTSPIPGHRRTTLEQLRRADQQIWEQLKTKTKKGIKLEADGRSPCDLHIEAIVTSSQVQALHSSRTRGGSNKKGRALDHSVLAKKGDPTRNARKGGKKRQLQTLKERGRARFRIS